MKTIKRELYENLVDEYIENRPGSNWAWIRRRANELYNRRNNGDELEGSSDVSGYLYDLWIERGEDTLNDNFGFWINGQICEELDLPNCKATREYHTAERY